MISGLKVVERHVEKNGAREIRIDGRAAAQTAVVHLQQVSGNENRVVHTGLTSIVTPDGSVRFEEVVPRSPIR